MAGCHSRLQAFLKTRILARNVYVPNERLFFRHSQPVLLQQRVPVTSLCIDYQSRCLQNGWKSCPLKTSVWHSEHTNLRYLHSSSKVLSHGKNAGLDSDGTATSIDSKKTDNADESDGSKESSVKEEKLSVFQRFKKTYKEHGKVLVGVHLATSAVWFGSFFYAAKVGVDVIPFMEWLGLSEKIINPFRNSSLGDVALAYLMYKLATPARYTVTLTGTNYAIKYLRKKGVMQPKDKSSSLRNLARDSRTEIRQKQTEVKTKTDEFETKLRQKGAEVRYKTNQFETKLKERRVKVKDRLLKFRSKFKVKRLKALGSRKSKRSPRSKR